MTISNEKIKFILIHGLFDSSSGQNNVEKLIPVIKKYYPNAIIDKDECDYGWLGAFKASWFYWATDIIQRITKALKFTGVRTVVIGHSNGCNFTMKALSKLQNHSIEIFMLSPALNAKYKFKEDFKSCHVLYTSTDKAVWFARFIVWSRMGAMGRYGPKSNDCRVTKEDHNDDGIINHSDYFKPKNHEMVFAEIRKKLNRNQL